MLVEKVYNLNSFQQQYEALLTLSVCDTIPNLIWNKDKSTLLSLIDWDNMLSIASLFCYSEENKYVDAALRIAQTCIMQEDCTENQKNASAFILDTSNALKKNLSAFCIFQSIVLIKNSKH